MNVMSNNIPEVKLGMIAVSRDCFVISLSEKRRAAIKAAYKGELYECPVTVENENDMLLAVAQEVAYASALIARIVGCKRMERQLEEAVQRRALGIDGGDSRGCQHDALLLGVVAHVAQERALARARLAS